MLALTMTLCAPIIAGCSQEDSGSMDEYASGLIAARMGDVAISEGEVTDYIADYRRAVNLSDDAAWIEYLTSTGETAASYREKTINQLAIDKLFEQVAKEDNIDVNDQAVQQSIENMRAGYNATDDETWAMIQEALNLDENTLRKSYEKQNLKIQVYEQEVPEIQVTDDDTAAYIDSTLLDTESFKLLRLTGSDYLPMQNELVRIQQSNEPLAAFMAAQTTNSLVRDDVGWVLADGSGDVWLSVMEGHAIPGLRDTLFFDGTTQQILLASEAYQFTDGSHDVISMPADLKETVAAQAQAKLWDEACQQWLREQLEAKLQINDAPMHLPYEVR